MSTEVAKKPRKNPWADLTPEEKEARMKKLREAKAAKGKPPTTLAELEAAKAEVLALRAELDAKTKSASLASNVEMYYEFSRNPKKGTEKITDPNDPRWAELEDFRRDVFGTFVIRKTERDFNGNITGQADLTCLARRPQPAREMMVRYLETGDHVQRLSEVVR